jgi:hypothetical protein
MDDPYGPDLKSRLTLAGAATGAGAAVLEDFFSFFSTLTLAAAAGGADLDAFAILIVVDVG